MELDPMTERKARRIGVQSGQFAYENRGDVDVNHVLDVALGEVSI